VVKEETVTEGKAKKKAKVLRKIPPEVIKQAKGVAIFTAMRSGIAPLGGAGGSGMVIARLPDGCEWSAWIS
jgi:lipid-binding SYLF domain-containing protein